MATRSLDLERVQVDKFITEFGRKPASSEDWDTVKNMTYGLEWPTELGGQQSPPPPAPGSPEDYQARTASLQSQLSPLQEDLGTAREKYTTLAGSAMQAQRGTIPGLNVLQEALKTKTGVYNAPLGESKIFEQAGIKGYGALASSLSARSQEIQGNFARFSSTINNMFANMKMHNQTLLDEANLALENYKMVQSEYDKVFNRMNELEDEERGYAKQLDLYERQAQLDLEMYEQRIPLELQKYEAQKQLDLKYRPPSKGAVGAKISVSDAAKLGDLSLAGQPVSVLSDPVAMFGSFEKKLTEDEQEAGMSFGQEERDKRQKEYEADIESKYEELTESYIGDEDEGELTTEEKKMEEFARKLRLKLENGELFWDDAFNQFTAAYSNIPYDLADKLLDKDRFGEGY